LLIAGVSDAVSFVTSLNPFLQFGVDLVTALFLWAVLGWSWVLLAALIPEALPVVSVFPTWTLVILALKGVGMFRKKSQAVALKD
jgi:predicted transporter